MLANKEKKIFPNLDRIRFIGASLIIVHHIEQYKPLWGIEKQYTAPFFDKVGQLGIILFFVLSGFLVTYSLLSEQSQTQNVSLGNFYKRRLLRIYPLYFLLILLAFFVFPKITLLETPFSTSFSVKEMSIRFLLFCLLLPNIVLAQFGIFPFLSHTWYIGVQEQIYLIFPLAIKYIKKNLSAVFYTTIIIHWCLGLLLKTGIELPFKSFFDEFWHKFNIDCVAIGGLVALFLFRKNRIIKILQANAFFYITLSVTLFLIIKGTYIPFIQAPFFAVLFGIIILNVASNKTLRPSLQKPVFQFTGKISYGMYLFHPVLIVTTFALFKKLHFFSNIILYSIIFIGTIAVASFSYFFIEKPFLKLKEK